MSKGWHAVRELGEGNRLDGRADPAKPTHVGFYHRVAGVGSVEEEEQERSHKGRKSSGRWRPAHCGS